MSIFVICSYWLITLIKLIYIGLKFLSSLTSVLYLAHLTGLLNFVNQKNEVIIF